MRRDKALYEQVLGTKLAKLPDSALEMWGFPSEMWKPGCSGTLVKMPGVPSGDSTLVYFHSEDCAIGEARFAKAGGKVFRPKVSIAQYGFISLGVDTEGNRFRMHSLK